jgi:hypothetical protein
VNEGRGNEFTVRTATRSDGGAGNTATLKPGRG